MGYKTEHIDVANYILKEIEAYNKEKKFQDRISLSVNRLQKLLYFCDIEYMKKNNGKSLFSENYIAWPDGPIILDIYLKFKQIDDSKIILNSNTPLPGLKEINNNVKLVVDDVLKLTKDLDTKELTELTKIKDGPWYQAYREDDKKHLQTILKEEMHKFYFDKALFEKSTKPATTQNKNFKISSPNSAIILEKNNQRFSISQSVDDDIWFSTSEEKMTMELRLSSRNYQEWQSYIIFENLMKSIIGRYILNGDNKKEYSILPEDFVDLENKIIIWHSDSELDNILKLEYTENKDIKISILKSKDAKEYYTNAVRVRTDGSEYGYYYQEFLEFFRQLTLLEKRLNKTDENIIKNKPQSLIKKYKY